MKRGCRCAIILFFRGIHLLPIMITYLLLGSNIGDSQLQLQYANSLIEFRCGRILNKSSIYRTEPWGMKDQNDFLNQCLALETKLSPKDLLGALKQIEQEMGRTSSTHWGPRIIDIDILFYGSEVIELDNLQIPHPQIANRKFTLLPLNELAADFIHPTLKSTIQQLLENCPDNSNVELLLV